MLLKLIDHNDTYMDVDMLDHPMDFHAGVAASVFVTLMSELGDKSFFMSAILAMHHSRTLTFIGSMLGQIIMTGVAVGLGAIASLIPDIYTKWASCICMTFFGIKMLKDGFGMPIEDEHCCQKGEYQILDEKINKQYEHSQRKGNEQDSLDGTLQSAEISTTGIGKNERSKPSSKEGSRRSSVEDVLVQAFAISFFGEWGDRSQIATILLASNENPYGVAVGSILGHIVCCLLAVIGGRMIGQKFPVKTMTQAGGVVFLLCAASAIIFD